MSFPSAPPPNGIDDTEYLQFMLANAGRAGVVELQDASMDHPYQISRPLFLGVKPIPNTNPVQYQEVINPFLVGKYYANQTYIQTMGYFPGIVRVPPAHMFVPTDGDALVLDGTIGKFVNLSNDCWFLNLNNLCPWECSFEYNLTTPFPPNAGEANIIASQGMLGMTQDTFTQAFSVNEREGLLNFRWQWNEHATGNLLAPNAISVGDWHAVKVAFDGVTAALWIDGVVVISQAYPNAIQQSWHEDVCIGSIPYRWPDGSVAATSSTGKIRNVVITGNGAGPGLTAPVSPKFAECYGPMVPIDAVFGRHWTVFRRQGAYDFNGVHLENFTLRGGTGFYLVNAVRSQIKGVDAFQCYNGFILNDNCYTSTLSNVHTGGGRIGIGFVGAANGLIRLDDFQCQDGLVGLLCSDGGGRFSNGFIYNNRGASVIVKGDWTGGTLDTIDFGDEGQGPPGPALGIYAAGAHGLKIAQCGGAYLMYPVPLITLDNSFGVDIDGFQFAANAATPALVRYRGEVPVITSPTFIGADTPNVPLIDAYD